MRSSSTQGCFIRRRNCGSAVPCSRRDGVDARANVARLPAWLKAARLRFDLPGKLGYPARPERDAAVGWAKSHAESLTRGAIRAFTPVFRRAVGACDFAHAVTSCVAPLPTLRDCSMGELRYAARPDEAQPMSDQNIFAAVLDKVRAANCALIADGLLPTGADQSRIVVEPPREAAHGDMATNAAMVLAKDAGTKPRELAQAIAEKLRADPLMAKAEVAGPGFINLTLKPAAWIGALRAVLEAGAGYGRSAVGQGTRVNVEYVSANPTGPMHVGHCRGAVFGDALANLLAFAGFEVTREYYINDAGAQVDVLARSAFLRYREALGELIGAIPEGLYPGDYLKPVGAALADQHGRALKEMPEQDWLPIVRRTAIDMMMAEIRKDLAALNVQHDVFFSERSLVESDNDAVAATIAGLRAEGEVYEGRLPPPKGAVDEDWEDREQTLFRTTEFGDDVDRPLKKSDGSYTYFASDIAYHKSKLDRGFRNMIDVWGADHGGYIRRMKAAVSAVSAGAATLDVKIVQLVKLLRAR